MINESVLIVWCDSCNWRMCYVHVSGYGCSGLLPLLAMFVFMYYTLAFSEFCFLFTSCMWGSYFSGFQTLFLGVFEFGLTCLRE